MAGNTRRNWSTDDLQAVVSVVKNDKISLKRAETVKPRLMFLVVNIVFGVIVSYILLVCTTIILDSLSKLNFKLGHCNLNACFPSSPMPGEHAGGRSLFIIHYA